jgi:tol-pal system protein YbgF
MMNMIVVLLVIAFVLSGCALPVVGPAPGVEKGAGTGTLADVSGELKQVYPVPLERLWDASLEALQQMRVEVKGARRDEAGGVIEATKADGTFVRLTLARTGPAMASVAIRVGSFGNKMASQDINARIANNLLRETLSQTELPSSSAAKTQSAQEALEKKVAEIGDQVQAMSRAQTVLNSKLDELVAENRFVQGTVEEAGRAVSELGHRVDELDRKVTLLTGSTEAVEERMKTLEGHVKALEDQTRALQHSPQLRGLGPPTPPASFPEAVSSPTSRAAAQPEPPAHPPVPPSLPLSAEELYNSAKNSYTQGDFDRAINGFRSYIASFPQTSLLPDAHYLLGESYYSQGDFRRAIQEFEFVQKQYPGSPRVLSAMLKQGYAYLELGENERAKTVFQSLIKGFPNSGEAGLARERLAELQ